MLLVEQNCSFLSFSVSYFLTEEKELFQGFPLNVTVIPIWSNWPPTELEQIFQRIFSNTIVLLMNIKEKEPFLRVLLNEITIPFNIEEKYFV